MKAGYFYIVASKSGVLYCGVTSALLLRTYRHKNHFYQKAFTGRYLCHKLIYYEIFVYIGSAIKREKQVKNWHREWKLNLIRKMNLQFRDLWEDIVEGYYKDQYTEVG